MVPQIQNDVRSGIDLDDQHIPNLGGNDSVGAANCCP